MNEIVEDFKISLIEDAKSPKTIESYGGDIKGFIEFLGGKGVEFNGILQRFYIVNYKNFLVENSYEVATGEMKEIVIENSKDRVKIAYGSDILCRRNLSKH